VQEDQSAPLSVRHNRPPTASLATPWPRNPFLDQEASQTGLGKPSLDLICGSPKHLIRQTLFPRPPMKRQVLQ